MAIFLVKSFRIFLFITPVSVSPLWKCDSHMANKQFTVAASAVLALGRDSIKDHTTAVVELVKNSYDADARIVELDLLTKAEQNGLIRIADTGTGMSEMEVEHNWLHIGYSEKRNKTTTAVFNRRKTGEKGIGRLSADRLGSLLELRTKATGKSPFGLRVDWSAFENRRGDVSKVRIPVLPEGKDSTPNLPKLRKSATLSTGTELKINNLRQTWTTEDIDRLHMELSLLIPPYIGKSSEFQLKFTNDIAPEYNGTIKPGTSEKALIEFKGDLLANGDLHYTLNFLPKKSNIRKTTRHRTSWRQMWAESTDKPEINESLIGPVHIRLSFFVQNQEFLAAANLSQTQLREFLKRNAGIRIYRDEIKVKPYGDPTRSEGDWLGLNDRRNRDPAGAGRSTFKLGANQVVGVIFISRDKNPNLVDSSSREGLIDSDALRQLETVAMKCVNHIETLHHTIHLADQDDPSTKAAKAKDAVNQGYRIKTNEYSITYKEMPNISAR